jgi:hypothetical protein
MPSAFSNNSNIPFRRSSAISKVFLENFRNYQHILEQSLSLNRQSLKSLNDEIKQHAFLRHSDPDHTGDLERLIPPIFLHLHVRLPLVHNDTLGFSANRGKIVPLHDTPVHILFTWS